MSKSYMDFHGYKVYKDGLVSAKRGGFLKPHYRKRRGGKLDARVSLYINGKCRAFTVQRLVASCFLGPIYGYEINHKNRDTLDNRIENLERLTASANQKHWRNCDLTK